MQAQFGRRIRELRKARGLTQRALAERSGVAEKYLSDIERGQVNVSLALIARLADGLGVPAKELFPEPDSRSDDDRQVARDLVAAITATADDDKAARLRLFLERVFR